MQLPFSHDAFLDVFGRYNTLLWLPAATLWLVSAAAAGVLLRERKIDARTFLVLLTVHWAWSGVAYHWFFFRPINPAAALFAALFVLQAILLGWAATTSHVHFAIIWNPRGVVAAFFLLYALAYPFVGLVFGLRVPRIPLFAVPCPTTLFTVGALMLASGLPRLINVVPIVWAAIAATAAWTLGITGDLALVPAGLLLALDTIAPTVLGARSAYGRD